jgi:coproporphyrinogen III oxidase
MIELDDQQKAAQAWFRSLRDSIWAMLEQLEDESTLPGDAGRFEKRVWDRSDHSGVDGGGG